MKVTQIREKAKALKVKNYSRMRKDDLIRAVQIAEGNTDCFKRIQDCGQQDCLWREDCQIEN
ncbi:MAG TPA: hypothetical protein ENJ63_01610 [Dissulfuribacter thermophilus]|uniref:Rho termination factor-like N-terminal domain-containing protein n=1 Tax=Dissulfuribacter thermophilus TaxID=1156395 RepID=A0A7V2WSE0_9BACT|nr:hypothetical protein [Dissulfuribacter thermophilus]